jgi:hypothetical protein
VYSPSSIYSADEEDEEDEAVADLRSSSSFAFAFFSAATVAAPMAESSAEFLGCLKPAHIAAVKPWLSRAAGSAPYSPSNFTHSTCPPSAAWIKGVAPPAPPAASASAPAPNRSCNALSCPLRAAHV